MRILLVEDDPAVSRLVEKTLKKENWQVDSTASGEDALELTKLYDYDLMVMDLGLPDIQGEKVLSALRKFKDATPVLVLTGSTEIEKRLSAFSIGADDFVTKPFDRVELIARIKAIVRRSQGYSQSVINVRFLTLDIENRIVEYDGTIVPMTLKEYQILELMVLRRGRIVSRDTILNHLYNGVNEPDGKVIDVFLSKLRRRLRIAGAEPDVLQTVRGVGYKID